MQAMAHVNLPHSIHIRTPQPFPGIPHHPRFQTPISVEDQPQIPIQPDGHVIYAYSPPIPQSHRQSTIDRILDFPGSDVVGFDYLQVVGSANGVVCMVQQTYARDFTLWNPATRSSLHLPASGLNLDPIIHCGASAGIGFDPSLNEYKIIRIICYRHHHHTNMTIPDAAEVFNFKTGRWTLLNNNNGGTIKFRVVTATCKAVIKDILGWGDDVDIGWGDDVDIGSRPMLLSFDVKKLVFDLEPFAWSLKNRVMCMGEIKEGCLGAMLWDVALGMSEDRVLDVWMKQDESGWSKIYRVEPHEGLPVVGRVLGFYGNRGIVQEGVGEEGNYLCMINLENNIMQLGC